MNEVQLKLIELLKKFDSLCRKFEIVYYLGGGSALGALRHKGFLPWDDDVDLYMTRNNYLKLLSVEKEFFSDDFILVNSTNFPKYGNTLVRCTDTHSTAITKARIVDGTPKGQFIEIFVLDPMPRDLDEQLLWQKKHWVYTELMSLNYRCANSRVSEFVDEKMYYDYVQRYNTEGRETILKELENELFSIDEKDADEYCSRWGLRHLIYNIEWFQEPRYVPFEDIQLPVATFAENVLRFDYGDSWMYIPNVENQIVHSFADSMTIGYQNFVNDYTQFINVQEISNSYALRKEKLMELFFIEERAKVTRRNLKEAQVKASIQYNLPNIDLEECAKNKEFDKIEYFFKTWYDNQYHASFWGYKKLIELDDDILYFALLPKLIQGQYSQVRKLLSWHSNEVSSKLQTMMDFVNQIREVYIAIDNHDENKARELINECKKIDAEYVELQFDCNKLDIMLNINDADEKMLNEYKNKCEKLLETYSNNGEIIALYADIHYLQHENDQALKLYKDAILKTQHGFIRMHIQDRINELERGLL